MNVLVIYMFNSIDILHTFIAHFVHNFYFVYEFK